MKKIKKIMPIVIAFIIGISTTVGATTIFNSKDITYSSDKTSKTNVKDSLDELYSKLGKCPEGQYCYPTPKPISLVEVGDYIRMTPTSTSYTLANELSGCDGTSNTCIQNTINPSELNIWRVIKKNEDGTIEVVSEYVSSEPVFLYGKVGYMNYVGALNTVAAQYTNEKYVERTRHMGYSNQIEYCEEYSSAKCPSDHGWEVDFELVKEVIGYSELLKPNGEEINNHFLAGRNNAGSRYVSVYGINNTLSSKFSSWLLYVNEDGYEGITPYTAKRETAPVRAILTLKKDIKLTGGDGKSKETAYQLGNG